MGKISHFHRWSGDGAMLTLLTLVTALYLVGVRYL
jgi:hypothetical protein